MLAPVAAYADAARPRAAFAFAWLQQTLGGALVVRWLLHALTIEYGVPLAPSVAFRGAGRRAATRWFPPPPWRSTPRLRPRAAAWAAPLLFAALFGLAEWLRAEPLAMPWLLAAHPLAARASAPAGRGARRRLPAGLRRRRRRGGPRQRAALGERRAPRGRPRCSSRLALGFGALRRSGAAAGGRRCCGSPWCRPPCPSASASSRAPRSATRERHARLTRGLAASRPSGPRRLVRDRRGRRPRRPPGARRAAARDGGGGRRADRHRRAALGGRAAHQRRGALRRLRASRAPTTSSASCPSPRRIRRGSRIPGAAARPRHRGRELRLRARGARLPRPHPLRDADLLSRSPIRSSCAASARPEPGCS